MGEVKGTQTSFTPAAAGWLSSTLPPLDLEAPPVLPPGAKEYFRYYGIDFDCIHYFGGVRYSEGTVAAQVFIPESPTRTVVFVHGYLQHSGLHAGIIGRLLESGYAVIAFDLPGHGLSSGNRADIDDFSTYADALDSVLRTVGNGGGRLPGPFDFLGHSTGCAVLIEYLARYGDVEGSIVFASPLVRSDLWNLSGFGNMLLGRFLDRVPRWEKVTTGDRQFLAFMRYDPLHITHVPMQWVRAHRAWNERVTTYPPFRSSLHVVQGRRDDVVDWHYNIPFLMNRFPDMELHLISEARHDLLQESREIREEVYRYVVSAFEKGA